MVVLLSPSPSNQGSELDHSYEPLDPAAWQQSSSPVSVLRRRSTRFLLVLLGTAVIVLGLASSESLQLVASRDGLLEYAKIQGSSLLSHSRIDGGYYTPSAINLPPALSSLPDQLRRITLISIWASNERPSYLNNFFRSAALNSDVADLLVIHITNDHSKCLDGKNDFSKTDGISRDAAWEWENGGNIRVVCLSREAYLASEADYLCSHDGWSCNETDHKAVLDRLHDRPDVINNDFKTLRGEMFQQYFIQKHNPLWAWTDMDMHLGRLDHIPFSLLSTVAFLVVRPFTPTLLFLPGQMTFFNLAAPGFKGAWKKYTPLSAPAYFCKSLEPEKGGFAEGGIDETWLSAAYLRHTEGYAGQGLTWAAVPDVHGQDIFIPGRKFVISGINVLEVDAELNREEIEAILTDAKNELVDEYSGWSDSGEASTAPMLLGQICHEAWFAPAAAQCVQPGNITNGDQFTRVDSVRRGTILRIGSDEPGQLHIHLEPDRRPRRWQRKLFLHYQEIKRQEWWWRLPPWFIGENDEVMEFDWKSQYIWRKGENRSNTLWENHNIRLLEDGSSSHIYETESAARQ